MCAGDDCCACVRDSAEGHYEEHRGKPFFAGLASFFASGPIVAMVREANSTDANQSMGAAE
jgi:nucleoside-diphosphate kinase